MSATNIGMSSAMAGPALTGAGIGLNAVYMGGNVQGLQINQLGSGRHRKHGSGFLGDLISKGHQFIKDKKLISKGLSGLTGLAEKQGYGKKKGRGRKRGGAVKIIVLNAKKRRS